MMSTITNQHIGEAVQQGLFKKDKSLPSWLFYDAVGDSIFQEIMQMPEYYLTRCEFEILRENKDTLLELFQSDQPFQLIELGAGDATKTEILLKHFITSRQNFTYNPIDISHTVLAQLTARLHTTLPELAVIPHQGQYIEALEEVITQSDSKCVILFLGASIGNFTYSEASSFMLKVSALMRDGDFLLVGFDLKKDPELIKNAYDDPQGITKRFNLNLLERLNRELGADFDLKKFSHLATYDKDSGEAKSFLKSLADQQIYFEELNTTLVLRESELIFTEVSLKYDQAMIETLASNANLQISTQLYDSKSSFTNCVFVKS